MEELLRRNRALFAGLCLARDEKDAFFDAIIKAYTLCL
jgi:hypothetical protein